MTRHPTWWWPTTATPEPPDQAGVDTLGFADCNDPALFVGAAEGRIGIVVPLDDNVLPHLYAPITAYLLGKAGLAQPSHPSP